MLCTFNLCVPMCTYTRVELLTDPLKNQGLTLRQKKKKRETHSFALLLCNNTQEVINLKLGPVPEFNQ